MIEAAPRIDPRVARTRKLLQDAFIALLGEKLLDDITVQDIAARATVNRATFYAHFIDKYALVDELIREGFLQAIELRQAAQAPNAEEHLRRMFLAVCDYLRQLSSRCKHGHLLDSLAETQIKVQLRELVRNALRSRMASRAHSNPRLELLITIVSWGIFGAALEWSQHPGVQSAEAFVDAALPLIVSSIAAFDGRPT